MKRKPAPLLHAVCRGVLERAPHGQYVCKKCGGTVDMGDGYWSGTFQEGPARRRLPGGTTVDLHTGFAGRRLYS